MLERNNRLKRLKRSDAIKLIERQDKVKIKDTDLFSNWLKKISNKELLSTIDKFRNKNFWYEKNGKWFNKNLIFQIENKKVIQKENLTHLCS